MCVGPKSQLSKRMRFGAGLLSASNRNTCLGAVCDSSIHSISARSGTGDCACQVWSYTGDARSHRISSPFVQPMGIRARRGYTKSSPLTSSPLPPSPLESGNDDHAHAALFATSDFTQHASHHVEVRHQQSCIEAQWRWPRNEPRMWTKPRAWARCRFHRRCCLQCRAAS